MSHPTHTGFSVPPTTSDSGRAFRAMVAALALPLRQSRAVGVGNINRRCAGHFCMLGLRAFAFAVGVGKTGEQPPASPQMRSANIGRSEAESWRDSVAQPAKVSPGFLECGQGNVLCEHPARPALIDDPRHFRPQVSRVGGSEPLAGAAPRLAGEPAADGVDSAAPRSGVEGSDVVMDREGRQDAIALALLEHLPAERVELDGADWPVPEQHPAEDPAADASEQMQLARHPIAPGKDGSASTARTAARSRSSFASLPAAIIPPAALTSPAGHPFHSRYQV